MTPWHLLVTDVSEEIAALFIGIYAVDSCWVPEKAALLCRLSLSFCSDIMGSR